MNDAHKDNFEMHSQSHCHYFMTGGEDRAERKAVIVTGLTVVAMAVEIAVGMAANSMALLADGFHMATHAVALGVAAFAYWYARRHANDPRYTFGVGKVGALAGFASAMILAMVAVGVAWESAGRLMTTQSIDFNEALAVAVFGLAVNVASAFILGHDHHGHDHHGHDHHGHDVNLKGAYLHVIADALTSVCAIVALLAGKYFGWWFLDPLMGLAGAVVVGVWAWGLTKEAGGVLLDRNDDADLTRRVRSAIEIDDDTAVTDLHLWRVGPGHWAAIVALSAAAPRRLPEYRRLLADMPEISHLTIEIHQS